MGNITYPLDTSGVSPANLVTGELHTVNESQYRDYNFIVPEFSPFFVDNFNMTLVNGGNTIPLQEDVDYSFALEYVTGTRTTGKAMYGGITIHNTNLNGILSLTYQTIGGDQIADRLAILTELAERAYNPRTTIWDILTNVVNAFPPTPHYQDYDQFFGQEELVNKLGEIRDAILTNSSLTQDAILNFFNVLNAGNLTAYVRKSGDSMSGMLTLAGNPTEEFHAVTKKYVDDLNSAASNIAELLSNYATTSVLNAALAMKLDKTNGTVNGDLTLGNIPTQPSHAVPKNYVDGIQSNLQLQISQINTTINSLTSDPVSKEYVDDQINELKAYISSIVYHRA